MASLSEWRHSRSSYPVILKSGKRCATAVACGFTRRTCVSTAKRWKRLEARGTQEGRVDEAAFDGACGTISTW